MWRLSGYTLRSYASHPALLLSTSHNSPQNLRAVCLPLDDLPLLACRLLQVNCTASWLPLQAAKCSGSQPDIPLVANCFPTSLSIPRHACIRDADSCSLSVLCLSRVVSHVAKPVHPISCSCASDSQIP